MAIPASLKIDTPNYKQEGNFEALFEGWEKIIIGANKSYEKGQLFTAIGAYYQAISPSKKLIAKAPSNYRSLSTIVTSFHNLTDTFLYCRQPQERMAALQFAYSLITQVEAIIANIEKCFSLNTDVLRFASIARQQGFLFCKKYPEFLDGFECHRLKKPDFMKARSLNEK